MIFAFTNNPGTRMTYNITPDPNPTHDDLHTLRKGLIAHAKLSKDQQPTEDFAFFIRDENHQIIGGANGYTFYGCVYVDQLWMDEKLRGQGYGAKLMLAAEQLGKKRGCTFAAVIMILVCKEYFNVRLLPVLIGIAQFPVT
jgi:GNAT superfamily N-acetyltransferase